jgi:hypothetical protein
MNPGRLDRADALTRLLATMRQGAETSATRNKKIEESIANMLEAVLPPLFIGSPDGDGSSGTNKLPDLLEFLAKWTQKQGIGLAACLSPRSAVPEVPSGDDPPERCSLARARQLRKSVPLWALGIVAFPNFADDTAPDLLSVWEQVTIDVLRGLAPCAIALLDKLHPAALLGSKVFTEALIRGLGPVRREKESDVRPCQRAGIEEKTHSVRNPRPLRLKGLPNGDPADCVLGFGKRIGSEVHLKGRRVHIVIEGNPAFFGENEDVKQLFMEVVTEGKHTFSLKENEELKQLFAERVLEWRRFVEAVRGWLGFIIPAAISCRVTYRVASPLACTLQRNGLRLGEGFTLGTQRAPA